MKLESFFLKNILFLTLTLFSSLAVPCSSFLMKTDESSFVFSKSYDWHFGEGYIITNPSGLLKKSLLLDNSKAAEWISKYSSITFNQYGAEFPNGGMNQKGLMVEILWLETTKYEATDGRPILNELQWIQYQLDSYASTKEVVANLNKIRIKSIQAKVHYMVCDKSAECATIEFINGKPSVHTKEQLPFKTITNSTYENSSSYIQKFETFGGTQTVPATSYESLDRFVRLNYLAKQYSPLHADPIEYAFYILKSVQKENYTQWQIVYDPQMNSIYFRTSFVTSATGLIETENLFTTCKLQRLYFDLQTPLRGQIKNFFKPLTAEENKKLVTTTLTKLMTTPPPGLIDAVSSAPFKMGCSQK